MRFTVNGSTYVDSEHRVHRKGGLRGRVRLVTGDQELVLNVSSRRAAKRLIDHLWIVAYGPGGDPRGNQALPF